MNKKEKAQLFEKGVKRSNRNPFVWKGEQLMKEYPSIDAKQTFSRDIIAFDKLDGSNIRAEWTKKGGFVKFGRRHGLLDDSNPILKKAPPIIEEKFGPELSRIFIENRWQKVTCFFEFFGPQSFAGFHGDGEEMECVLLDVAIHPKGILNPSDFVKIFGHRVAIPKILHRGKWNQELTKMVNEGKLDGMTFEGVVCKGAEISPGLPLMFKVKNHEWYSKLRERCNGNEKLFEQLS